MHQNGTPRQTIRAFAGLLAEFDRSQDFHLKGVWEARRYAPTFTLNDGSKLRPLTAQTFLRRSTADGTACFTIVPLDAVGDEPLMKFAAEGSWNILSRDQP
jgi:hypothetical protein